MPMILVRMRRKINSIKFEQLTGMFRCTQLIVYMYMGWYPITANIFTVVLDTNGHNTITIKERHLSFGPHSSVKE